MDKNSETERNRCVLRNNCAKETGQRQIKGDTQEGVGRQRQEKRDVYISNQPLIQE